MPNLKLLIAPLLLVACNTTQNISVENTTTTSGITVNTTSTVKIRPTQTKIAHATDVTVNKAKQEKTGTQRAAKKLPDTVDKSDLNAVYSYCEKVSFEAVFIKEKCKTKSERNVCRTAQFGNEVFDKEFNYCLSNLGWEQY